MFVCVTFAVNGAGSLMSADGLRALAAGVPGQLPAYNSIFLPVT